MIFTIRCDPERISEIRYVFDFIFSDTSFDYVIEAGKLDECVVSYMGTDLYLTCEFLSGTYWDLSNEDFHSLLNTTVEWLDCKEIPLGTLPIILGRASVTENKNETRLNFDAISTMFIYLSRLEEWLIENRDVHGRFRYVDSISYRYDLILRPIADEYRLYLLSLIERLFLVTCDSSSVMRVNYSCDVDFPVNPILMQTNVFLKIGWRYLKRLEIKRVLAYLYDGTKALISSAASAENYKNVVYMSRQLSRCTFNFIPCSSHTLDYGNDISRNDVSKLIRLVSSNGSQVGVHFGYDTFNDQVEMDRQANFFKTVVGSNLPATLSSRQHFFRFDVRFTPKYLLDSGIRKDCSLGFAEVAGFRAGTSRDFSYFDLNVRRTTELKFQPLILMDASLFDAKYQNMLDAEKILAFISMLKNRCFLYDGNFNVLWHNDSFDSDLKRNVFSGMVDN